MGVHAFAAIIGVVSVVVGIIVAITASITTGVIIAATGWGVAGILGILNIVRLWRNPDKLIPKDW